jgi:AAA+ superfamily predicted ATPase
MDNEWYQQNEQYLVTALAWLQELLRERAGLDPKAETTTSKKEILAINQKARDFLPALHILSQQFGLSIFEEQLLLFCVALELNTQIATLCAQIQDNPPRPYPTFALALTLFADPDWSVVMADGALRYWQLIEVIENSTTPLTVSPLRADMRIVHYLKGVNHLDARLKMLVTPLSQPFTAEVPPSQQATINEIIKALERSEKHQQPYPVIQLLGPDTASCQQLAQATANQLGLQLYRLPLEQLPTQVSELTTLARLWHRETRLLPLGLYIDGSEIDPKSTQATVLKQFLDRCQGICFLDLPDKVFSLPRSPIAIEVAKPTIPEQRHLWQSLLDEHSSEMAMVLSSQFCLNTPDIIEIATRHTGEADSPSSLWNACLNKTRPKLDNLAQRIEVKATWEDVVLPEEEMALLHEIANQVRQRSRVYDDWGFRNKMNRGLGINALFAGESGTGKTMAAEVIANDLQLHLYRIDLSAVVSKYIGETEKNLRKLFDAAEDGGAILFFDEADALFGKRSEVKDSHDRYANIEINYLLQRIEAFRGLAILATNLKGSLDTAFLRRLRFIVTFPVPGRSERQQLWEKVFPKETPVADLDYKRLARLNLTGGNIHSIAINAAFLAADQSEITMAHVLMAARGEYRKLERPINEEDFRL